MTIRETSKILVDIIRNKLALAADRVYIYNQDFKIPQDSGLFVVVQYNSSKPFASANRFGGTNVLNQEELSVNLREEYSIHLMSRDSSSRLRKEEVFFAFNSTFAQEMQEMHYFKLAWFDKRMINVSSLEGGSTMNRFSIDISVLRGYSSTTSTTYYDQFSNTQDFD